MAKVLVSDPNFGIFTDSMERLRKAGHETVRTHFPITEEELIPSITDAEALISGPDPVGARAIRAAFRLRIISRFGVGVDNVDIPAATGRRIIVTNAAGVNSDAVADFTFCLMLALSRDLCSAVSSVRQGRWEPFRGVEVNRKTLGVIGTGNIGRRVIRRALGFSMRILAHDIVHDSSLVSDCGVTYVSLIELLDQSDFVTIHVPRLPETIGLIGKAELARMKPTAYLINTARGKIVDEEALCRVLKNQRIAGAALDVFAEEPTKSAELLALDNLLATSHIASSTEEAMRGVDGNCLENVLRVLKGKEPLSPVNYPFPA
ncbi:MAG TPA: phosphoglycerate dehydrogenase [Spirochaetia bacterium]|nr:phosphoglycerate dehydrogenase [Spirochaetia bacterium]